MSITDAMAEAAIVKKQLGIAATLDQRIAKVRGNGFQYATAGDSKAFINEIESLRAKLGEAEPHWCDE